MSTSEQTSDSKPVQIQEAIEAFQEYANHRKDKGAASAKINAWNRLVFKIDALKQTKGHPDELSKAQARIAELESENRDLRKLTDELLKGHE